MTDLTPEYQTRWPVEKLLDEELTKTGRELGASRIESGGDAEGNA